MLFTGQRRSDVHRMTWRDIGPKTGRIKVIQQKTGVKIQVPLHRDLLPVLEKARHNHVSILVTEWGKPFTVDGFSGFMRDAIRAAGYRWIVSRMDCARPPVVAWRKPDARRSRSWRCLATSRLRKRSDTRRKPTKSGSRRMRCRG
jgi:integrase